MKQIMIYTKSQIMYILENNGLGKRDVAYQYMLNKL